MSLFVYSNILSLKKNQTRATSKKDSPKVPEHTKKDLYMNSQQ